MIALKLGILQAPVTSLECGHMTRAVPSPLSFNCRCTFDYIDKFFTSELLNNRSSTKMQPAGVMLAHCSQFITWLMQMHVRLNILSLFSLLLEKLCKTLSRKGNCSCFQQNHRR
uniref:Uncharacterized protein n=1 Tax=Rhipicephalus zambeziensis TaxID=60191 RepID=A0A224YEC2_9ACAR